MRFLLPFVLFASLLVACDRGDSGVVKLATEDGTVPAVASATARASATAVRGSGSPSKTVAATATKQAGPAKATPTAVLAGGHTWYTSSAGNAKYYYCDLDDGWKTLSTKTLRQYSSEEELLAEWGTKRVKHTNSMC